jgi:hypothetical protein
MAVAAVYLRAEAHGWMTAYGAAEAAAPSKQLLARAAVGKQQLVSGWSILRTNNF